MKMLHAIVLSKSRKW